MSEKVAAEDEDAVGHDFFWRNVLSLNWLFVVNSGMNAKQTVTKLSTHRSSLSTFSKGVFP